MFKIIEGDFKNNKYSDENPNDAAFLYRREANF